MTMGGNVNLFSHRNKHMYMSRKILGTTSVVRSIENRQDVLQKIHKP